MTDLFAHNHHAILFFPALFLSLWLTHAAVRLSHLVGAVDRPGDRKIHDRSVPRLGGLAVAAGLALPLLLFREIDRTLAGFLLGGVVAAGTGFLDDVYRIRPAAKFLGETLAASAFVLASGAALSDFGDFLGAGVWRFGVLAVPVTVFCMVGVMNAFNLSDGLDGLAGGIAAIACGFLGLFAYLGGHWVPLAVLVCLFGALLGFLRYNTHPARLFMGDTGSLLLGYSLSAVAVLLVRENGEGVRLSPVPVAAVLALPIVDTLLVMARRLSRGENPFLPDRTHLHHRLLDLGLPHAGVVSVIYVSAAAFGVQAWALRNLSEGRQFAAVLLLSAVIHGGVHLAKRTGIRWHAPAGGGGEASPGPVRRRISGVLGKSVGAAGGLIAAGLLVPAAAIGPVPRSVALVALGAAAAIVALFPWRSRVSRPAVCCGLLYAACACLLAILQGTPARPGWVPGYLAALSAVVLAWVLLKMRYRGHGEIVLVSSFEILVIGISVLIPLVMAPALGWGDGVRRTMLAVCLESVAFLLAIKILVRSRPWHDFAAVWFFLAALAVIAAR